MNKKETLRLCIACREMKDKRTLIRVVKNKDGRIFIDRTGKANGRGAYVCKNTECLEKLKKQKSLNKAFKCAVDNEIYENLKEVIIGEN